MAASAKSAAEDAADAWDADDFEVPDLGIIIAPEPEPSHGGKDGKGGKGGKGNGAARARDLQKQSRKKKGQSQAGTHPDSGSIRPATVATAPSETDDAAWMTSQSAQERAARTYVLGGLGPIPLPGARFGRGAAGAAGAGPMASVPRAVVGVGGGGRLLEGHSDQAVLSLNTPVT
jgi:hypothetical protein